MKIAAVNNCVEVLSNSIAKLPFFVMNAKKERVNHDILYLLTVRPNETMTPSAYKKLIECQRLLYGNSYTYIERDKYGKPQRLVPLPPQSVQVKVENNIIRYVYTNASGNEKVFSGEDIIHLKAYSEDGIHGISVLERARLTIETAAKHQAYENNFYAKNARPSGVLTIPTKLEKEAKEKLKEEWTKAYNGTEGMFKPAVLDIGIDYKPLAINQRDAQFIQSKEISIQDICRFFGVPLYKVQAGKQSYSSNEQNAIGYVVDTLHPTVTQYEQEFTYKGLPDSEVRNGLQVRVNMNAELRGDSASRAAYYKDMLLSGVYSVNEVRALEDLSETEGGDVHFASLNYVPLDSYEELSENRNTKE